MTENPLPIKAVSPAVSTLRSNQDVVFIDVGARRIEPNVVRDGLPIAVHEIDTDVLNQVVIGEPVILYRIVGQSVRAGTAAPLGTAIDVTMAVPGSLPVSVVRGTHSLLKETSVNDAFGRLVAGKPQAQRLVLRASEGPLGAADEQALKDLFNSAQVPIRNDVPGEDVTAAIETLKMLTTFGGP